VTKVGFLIHPQVEREVPHLRQAEGWLREHGITCWVASRETPGEVARTSLLVTLGGDGTFLYGARLGLAVPRREPPVRAFGHGTQRITGVRGRG